MKRIVVEPVKWSQRAQINSISPSIIVTPLAYNEFNCPQADFYRGMFSKYPAGCMIGGHYQSTASLTV